MSSKTSDFVAVEEMVAVLTGAITFINEVLPVITFWWRFVSLLLFLVLIVDLCLRSRRAIAAFPSPCLRLFASILVLGLVVAMLWTPMRVQYMRENLGPSFVYVVPGVVLYEGSPPKPHDWIMQYMHYGPEVAYNVGVNFQDINLQKERPLDIAGINHYQHFDEADAVSFGDFFRWAPPNISDEHYDIIIHTRSGIWRENLRIEGLVKDMTWRWVYKMSVLDAVSGTAIINCQDPEFPDEDRSLSPCFPTYLKHQGEAHLPLRLPAANRVLWVAMIVYVGLVVASLYVLLALWWMGVPLTS